MEPGQLSPPALVPVVVDETHRHHDPPFELNAGQRVAPVFERPARLDAIGPALRAAGHRIVPAGAHDDALLATVHDPAMLAFLRDGHAAWIEAGGPPVMIADTFRSPRWAGGGRPTAHPMAQLGWWCVDTATPLVAGSYRAARAATDVALSALDRVLAGEPAVMALTRPPGHHAGADYFGGFCLLNHAAVTAQALADAGGRVAIVDVDVHHGNGTQDIFWRDPQVLYASLHGDPDHLFPYFSGAADERGEGPGRGTTCNVPLPAGTDDEAYLRALETVAERVMSFAPTALVVSLGLDAAGGDPLGSLALTTNGYRTLGARLAALELPTVLILEGGYGLDELGALATAVLDGFSNPSPR